MRNWITAVVLTLVAAVAAFADEPNAQPNIQNCHTCPYGVCRAGALFDYPPCDFGCMYDGLVSGNTGCITRESGCAGGCRWCEFTGVPCETCPPDAPSPTCRYYWDHPAKTGDHATYETAFRSHKFALFFLRSGMLTSGEYLHIALDETRHGGTEIHLAQAEELHKRGLLSTDEYFALTDALREHLATAEEAALYIELARLDRMRKTYTMLTGKELASDVSYPVWGEGRPPMTAEELRATLRNRPR